MGFWQLRVADYPTLVFKSYSNACNCILEQEALGIKVKLPRFLRGGGGETGLWGGGGGFPRFPPV